MNPHITSDQRVLLQRARGTYLPTIRLRRLTKHSAHAQLRLFMLAVIGRGNPYARVIFGKGISSAGYPVLKPMVIDWCDQAAHIIAIAPEIDDDDGNFGSLIVELRSSKF